MALDKTYMRNWIYSYLKYSPALTQEQRDKVKKRFLDLAKSETSEKEKANKETSLKRR